MRYKKKQDVFKLNLYPRLCANILFIGTAVVAPLLVWAAPASTGSTTASVHFVEEPGPPPGFEASELNISQTNYISIYYGNAFLGNVMGTYDDNQIKLSNLTEIVKNIPGIIQADQVIKALSGTLATHADQVCPVEKATPANTPKPAGSALSCGIISPDVAGVIFDSATYKATLFVNPKYLDAKILNNSRPSIPDSTAGFSYVANNNLSLASSTGSQTYSLNNLSIFAKGNNALNINANVTQNTGSSVSAYSSATLQTVTFTRLKNGNYYQAGMLTPDSGGGFIGGPTILGASIQNYGILSSAVQGNPIVIFLPLPAQVQVYRNGFLISTQTFNAGKQQLDTSSFPAGSYDLTLKIADNSGQIRTQTQFFVKQSALPPASSPNYQMSLGVLQSNAMSSGSSSFIIPHFAKIPLFSYSQLRKVGTDFGLQSAVMTTFNRIYLAETLNYYGMDWQVGPGILVSNNHQYGWLLNFVFAPIQYPEFQFMSNTQKIISSTDATNAALGPLSASTYSPVTQSDIQSSNTLNWTINDKTSASASAAYSKSPGGGGSVQYGFDLSRTILSNELISLESGVSTVKATGQPMVFSVNVSASFDTVYNINVGIQGGYSNSNTITNENGTAYNVYKPNYSETLSKNMIWGKNNNNNFDTSVNFNQNFTSTANILTMNYNSDLLAGNLTYGKTTSKQFDNIHGSLQSTSQTVTQLSGNLSNNIAVTAGGIAFGYQNGESSGVMADIVAPAQFSSDIFINGQDYGTVKSNDSKAIFLAPYQTYQVTIQPSSAAAYGFDSRPKIETLYKGNIAHLKWVLSKQYVLFAQIVDHNNKPLANLLLTSGNPGDFNTTDENGYIQANIPEDSTTMVFKNINGQDCNVVLHPALIKTQDQNGLVVLSKPLVCNNL